MASYDRLADAWGQVVVRHGDLAQREVAEVAPRPPPEPLGLEWERSIFSAPTMDHVHECDAHWPTLDQMLCVLGGCRQCGRPCRWFASLRYRRDPGRSAVTWGIDRKVKPESQRYWETGRHRACSVDTWLGQRRAARNVACWVNKDALIVTMQKWASETRRNERIRQRRKLARRRRKDARQERAFQARLPEMVRRWATQHDSSLLGETFGQ